MMILQIRPMMSELVQRAIRRAAQTRRDMLAHSAGSRSASGPEHVTRRGDRTGNGCGRHLEAVGDAARLVDEQCCRRPRAEIREINLARIAGQSDDQIRSLVRRLHEARKALAERLSRVTELAA